MPERLPVVVGRMWPADAVDARMTRRVEAAGDGVGRCHHVWHGEQQRSDAGHDRAEANPAGDVATTTQVAHDYGRQDTAHLTNQQPTTAC